MRELGELGRALDATRAGSGTAVLVAGEAGIGKTRLASELAARARDAGFEVLLGRSIDLVGTELPYQPLVEAVGPLGGLPQVDGEAVGSQLRVFQETLALLSERAAAAPVLLVLEDLHWAGHLYAGSVPRPQPARPAGAAAGDLPCGRARLGRAGAPAGRWRAALGGGAGAGTRPARPRRADGAARRPRRRCRRWR